MIYQIDLKSSASLTNTKSLVFIYADDLENKLYLSKLYKHLQLELLEVEGEYKVGYFVFDDTFHSNI